MEQSVAVHALQNLIATGIVLKEKAVTDEANKKKVQYILKDSMFKFWYQFVPDGMGAIELDRGEIFYQKVVKPKISGFMGSVFEQICRHYTLICGVTGKLDYFVTTVACHKFSTQTLPLPPQSIIILNKQGKDAKNIQ